MRYGDDLFEFVFQETDDGQPAVPTLVFDPMDDFVLALSDILTARDEVIAEFNVTPKRVDMRHMFDPKHETIVPRSAVKELFGIAPGGVFYGMEVVV